MKQPSKKAKYLSYDYEAAYQRAAEDLEKAAMLSTPPAGSTPPTKWN